jgi:hypothetical protein
MIISLSIKHDNFGFSIRITPFHQIFLNFIIIISGSLVDHYPNHKYLNETVELESEMEVYIFCLFGREIGGSEK